MGRRLIMAGFLITGCNAISLKKQASDSVPLPPDPTAARNLVGSSDSYSRIILTVNDDQVIDDLANIPQLAMAFKAVTLLRTAQNGDYKIYLVRLANQLDPVPYINYLKTFPGVTAVELDQMINVVD